MASAELSDLTVTRLQAVATPLVDTFDSVIARLLDHWDATKKAAPKIVVPGEPLEVLDDGTMVFDPASPPQLSFTTCLQVEVDGVPLSKGEAYWNSFMIAMIRSACQKGHSLEAVHAQFSVANAEIGEKEGNGYKFIPDVGLSVQGQDSNAAFKQGYLLAAAYGISFNVLFAWQNNQKAVYANRRGYFEFDPTKS